ncbi:MAG TPA: agmatine deiminase family protein, partial [Bacteroidota bacterium]
MSNSPASLGYRMPAEWELHEATWLGWPHNKSDWPGKFQPIPWVYGEIVRFIARGEIVRIIVESKSHRSSAQRILEKVGVDPGRVEFFTMPTDRGWTRDFGPMFAKSAREVAINGFGFTGWAKYPNHKKDAQIHAKAARKLGVRVLKQTRQNRPFVLEGGAIDVNGRGTLLTTEECMLDQKTQVRNPGMSKADIEQALKEALGVTNILWLGKGIAGDDTHGHVDDLARFVNPTTIVLCEEKNPGDVNYQPLEENRERLKSMRLENGSSPEVVSLPMPAPLFFDGVRLPASYANFSICNSAVLVPTFNDPKDRQALGILSELIPDRPVIGIHAVDLVWGFGTLHCLTQ